MYLPLTYSFLDESKNTDLIRWSDDGNSFIVLDEEEFAKTLIPELFKHNNYASFVRQLNMYGFHKKVGLSDNSMRASERKNKSPSEYSNPYFRRGHPDLLWLIQKPKNASGHGSKGSKGGGRAKAAEPEAEEGDHEEGGEEGGRDRKFQGQLTLSTDSAVAKEHLASVYRELQTIRNQQQIISSTIMRLRKEHEQLHAQAASFQEQHNRHENSINAILTFLATVYNRSLQGHDGVQGLVNSFAGAIPQETTQGNVVDMSDYITNLGAESPGGQRGFKKQPLLLKAPPALGPNGQPLSANSLPNRRTQFSGQGGKSKSPDHDPGYQSGNIEELFDQGTSPTANPPQRPQQENHSAQGYQQPQRDIMSLIQSSNRNSLPTSQNDFPAVLSSLENAGGNSPLSAAQRADMLRLIANESHADSSTPGSSNNALISPNPPPMPHGYPTQLANTRAEIDNLIKMQAEQDRSVQNLTNLLQPLSPTGTIPGLDPSGEHAPPPPLDIDNFISSDYFGDYPDANKSGSGAGYNGNGQSSTLANNTGNDKTNANIGTTDHNELFDFDSLPDGPVGDFFGDSNASTTQQNQDNSFFGNFDSNFPSSRFGYDGANDVPNKGPSGQGRVVESFSSSEGTSPANTVDGNLQVDTGTATTAAPKDQTSKRRKRNQ